MWYSAVGCIVTLLLSLLVAPLAAVVAQPREKVPRVGYLNPGSSADPARQRRFEAFRQGLRELGYVEGQTIALEPRWAEGSYERYPALVADLVRVQVDVIVVAARALGVQLHMLEARGSQEIDSAFAAMTRERVGALVVLADAILGLNQRSQIAALAAERRLPAVYGIREYAEAGGLIVYSADFLDLERRAATFVDKILKGAKPGDLPVGQPTKFQLALNLKTTQALGITFPPTLLFQADEVIR